MATMLPSIPREYTLESKEGLMFDALKNGLPDDYFVFHSVKLLQEEENLIRESECDFIVYNRHKGLLFIEAKAGGGIRYIDNTWYYTSGKEMAHGGPYNQASASKYKYRDIINKSPYYKMLFRCKLLHAVWFVDIKRKDLGKVNLPPEASEDITLTYESLGNPLADIERIYSLEYNYKKERITRTDITDTEEDYLLRTKLCPEFKIFAPATFMKDVMNNIFNRMLKEQESLLNYLVDQHTAVINGAAGTGKTMVAIEKANRCAANGDKVLFLCYNKRLSQWLKDKHSIEHVEYYTLDALACSLCKTSKADYEKMKLRLDALYNNDEFPWKHIIIDEGQDFGKENIDECDILDKFKEIIELMEGDFYIFYDNLQNVQGEKIPGYIANADCKLTLYRNCRNTEQIAVTSLRPISDRKPKMIDGAITGVPTRLHYLTENNGITAIMNSIIDSYKGKDYDSFVILTCETEDKSILAGSIKDGKYKKIDFDTCRKFKGLEADVVILVDVTKELFNEKNVQRFYVGASRAKFQLDIIASMDDDDCREVLETYFKRKKINIPKRVFASALNAVEVIHAAQ